MGRAPGDSDSTIRPASAVSVSRRTARRAACASAARSRAASVRKNRVPGKAPRAACCSHHSEPTLPKSITIGMVGSTSRAYWIMVEEDTKMRS